MKTTGLFALAMVLTAGFCARATAADAVDVGGRLELFVDDFLVESLLGDATLHMHRPEPREVVLTTDQPWEGNTCAYYTIFRDGDLYRMYYRGSHYNTQTKKAAHPEVTCYAESSDGVHWEKPNLGLFEFNGSKQNNIVWDGIGTHCFVVFKDGNPACPPEARYKGISRGRPRGKKGLYLFQSPDGIHWKLIQDKPAITEGAFDSQNLAFWDPRAGLYREYHRTFTNGVRSIMTGTSEDYVHWSKPVLLEHGDAPNEHLYTNAVRLYERAPHIFLGFPTRYLPKEGQRVEPVLMTSRDGLHFKRWSEPLIPEDAPEDRKGNRSNYMTWGMVQLPGNAREYSVYATEAYYTGPDTRVRRFVYRVDGFVSVRAEEGGELLSKPLTFSGKALRVNYKTTGNGRLRAELQDTSSKAIDGYSLADCKPLRGDAISQVVGWTNGTDVSALAGQPIRVRFVLEGGDLYSMTFGE